MRTLLLILLLPGLAAAQFRPGGTVQGSVVDSLTREPLRAATVSLLSHRDSAFVAFALTGSTGSFRFRHVPPGAYRVLVTYVGYANGSRAVTVTPEAPAADAGVLALATTTVALPQVVVTQESPPVSLRGDTLSFHAGAFKVRPNAPVEELLRKLPGLEVDRDGTVRAQGETVQRVLVDGKPFFGDDPKLATRNLPAELVAKIEVFDQRSDQAAFSGFDDGSREKTINITTRPDKRKGVFGEQRLGAGTAGRYQATAGVHRYRGERQLSLLGMANNVNEPGFTVQDLFGAGPEGPPDPGGNGPGGASGAGPVLVVPGRGGNPAGRAGAGGGAGNVTETAAGGVNFRDAWGRRADFSGSYFLNYSDAVTRQRTYRQYGLPDSSFSERGQHHSRTRSTGHCLHFRLDSRLDSLTTLRASPDFRAQGSTFADGRTSAAFGPAGDPLNAGTNALRTEAGGLQGSGSLLLMRKFRQPGRTFSVNLKSAPDIRRTDGQNQSENNFFGGGPNAPAGLDVNQQTRQRTGSATHTASTVYTEPLSLRHSAQFGYTYATTGSRSARSVSDRDEATGRYDRENPALSNRFGSTFALHRPGVALRTRRLRYAYTLGLDLQTAVLRTDDRTAGTRALRRFTHWLPNAGFELNLGRSRTLRVHYRTRVTPPSVAQLQPVIDRSDPLRIRQGNPLLQPEYSHQATAWYNAFNPSNARTLLGVLHLDRTDNKIADATRIGADGVQTIRPVNTRSSYQVRGVAAAGLPLGWLGANLNLTTRVRYDRGVSLVNERPNYARRFTAGQGLSLYANPGRVGVSLGGNLNYQQAAYSLPRGQNTRFFTQTLDLNLFCPLPFGLTFTGEAAYTRNGGQSAGYNQSFTRVNLGLEKSLFRNQAGELKVQVNDLLNQNRSISRNASETYVEDVENQVLRRFLMISFTYHLRRFGGSAPPKTGP